jgi:hypothetical protein
MVEGATPPAWFAAKDLILANGAFGLGTPSGAMQHTGQRKDLIFAALLNAQAQAWGRCLAGERA